MRFADLPASPAHPLQSLVEFGALWDYCAHLIRPRHVVEIGSLYGGTLWYWLLLPDVEQVTSVDLHARPEWQGWTQTTILPVLRIIEGDSHDEGIVDRVRAMPPVDVLFIDGDHTYDGVSADWRLWSPLVRPGGLVALHDTVLNGTRDEPGIRRFVAERKRQWRLLSIELFDPDGAGITAFVM